MGTGRSVGILPSLVGMLFHNLRLVRVFWDLMSLGLEDLVLDFCEKQRMGHKSTSVLKRWQDTCETESNAASANADLVLYPVGA